MNRAATNVKNKKVPGGLCMDVYAKCGTINTLAKTILPFPAYLSPMSRPTHNLSPPLIINDSYLLNRDNSFAMPLTLLNNTYVFDMNPIQR